MPPPGYPAFLQYLQSGRVRKTQDWNHAEIDVADPSGRRKCRVCILGLRRAAGGSSRKN